jgi:predicted DCC family thiol-disulfide oxidoreductase YuxK
VQPVVQVRNSGDNRPVVTVVLDGYCSLCNRTVTFLRRRALPGTLEYVANPESDQTTVVVIDAGRKYTKSDAVVHLLGFLRRPWPALRVVRFVPRPVRDAVYDVVAARRYRWFGRTEYACALNDT